MKSDRKSKNQELDADQIVQSLFNKIHQDLLDLAKKSENRIYRQDLLNIADQIKNNQDILDNISNQALRMMAKSLVDSIKETVQTHSDRLAAAKALQYLANHKHMLILENILVIKDHKQPLQAAMALVDLKFVHHTLTEDSRAMVRKKTNPQEILAALQLKAGELETRKAKLRLYLNHEIDRLPSTLHKYKVFKTELEKLDSINDLTNMRKTLIIVRQASKEHRPSYNPAKVACRLFFKPTSYQTFKTIFDKNNLVRLK